MSAALLILVASLGGTAYAANGSLPGQPLYPIKINVTEPVETALIPSASGKAAWHAILAERRLDEATQLAVKGSLDSATQQSLSDNFSTHVRDSIAAADELQKEGDVNGALAVRSDLEARITAHEDILGLVADHLAASGAADATSTEAVRTLLTVVHDRQDTVEGARLALEDSEDAASSRTPVFAKTTSAMKADDTSAKPAIMHSPREITREARTLEIASILRKNSALISLLGPVGTSTTATSTATSTIETASSTVESDQDIDENAAPDGENLRQSWPTSQENIKN